MTPVELILTCAAITTAIGVLGSGVFWLVWPRVEDRFEAIARQLDHTTAGSLGSNAQAAAKAVEAMPRLADKVERLAAAVDDNAAWRTDTDRRMGNIEQALVALLGRELAGRLIDDTIVTTTTTAREATHHAPKH